MTTGLLLRVDQFVTNDYFKDPAARREQREVFNLVLELFEDLACHAHGTVSIASNSAVFDAQSHVAILHIVVVDLARQRIGVDHPLSQRFAVGHGYVSRVVEKDVLPAEVK